MLSANFETLSREYDKASEEQQKLHDSIQKKLIELANTKKEIARNLAQNFIDNFSEDRAEIELMFKRNSLISNDQAFWDFLDQYLKDRGFFYELYSGETEQLIPSIDLSSKEMIEKALNNIDWIFDIIKPVKLKISGKETLECRRISLSTIKTTRFSDELINNLYLIKIEGKDEYQILFFRTTINNYTYMKVGRKDLKSLIEKDLFEFLTEKYNVE